MAEGELPLERIFSTKSVAKVLDFLLVYRKHDYSKTDISREADVEWKNMLTRVWPILEKYKLVTATRTIGRAQLFEANMENPIMQALAKIQVEIATYDNQPLITAGYSKQPVEEQRQEEMPSH